MNTYIADRKCLSKIPREVHKNLNQILQWGTMFVLTLYKDRCGQENISFLKENRF